MFLNLLQWTGLYAHNGRGIKQVCALAGLRHPAQVTDVYLAGESADYLQAAIYAVNQSGE